MPGAGASSSTFWCRRCTEQSRSNRYTQLPWRSANTWISTWRGRVTYRSISTWSSPKLLDASRLHDASASANSPAAPTMRIPLPPPPADGFSSTG